MSTFETTPIAYDCIEGCHHLVSLRRKFKRNRAIRSFAFRPVRIQAKLPLQGHSPKALEGI